MLLIRKIGSAIRIGELADFALPQLKVQLEDAGIAWDQFSIT